MVSLAKENKIDSSVPKIGVEKGKEMEQKQRNARGERKSPSQFGGKIKNHFHYGILHRTAFQLPLIPRTHDIHKWRRDGQKIVSGLLEPPKELTKHIKREDSASTILTLFCISLFWFETEHLGEGREH